MVDRICIDPTFFLLLIISSRLPRSLEIIIPVGRSCRLASANAGTPPTQHQMEAVAPWEGPKTLAGVSLPAVSWLACAMVVAYASKVVFLSVRPPGEEDISQGHAPQHRPPRGSIPKQTPSTNIDARPERAKGEGDQHRAPRCPKQLQR